MMTRQRHASVMLLLSTLLVLAAWLGLAVAQMPAIKAACSDPNCIACAANPAICTSCNSTYGLTSSGKCAACNFAGCALCTNLSRCNVCANSNWGPDLGGTASCSICKVPNCVYCGTSGPSYCDSCNQTYGQSADKMTCNRCPNGCQTCIPSATVSGAMSCQTCLPGYSSTMIGYSVKGYEYNCTACPDNCASCSINFYGVDVSSSCYSCNKGFYADTTAKYPAPQTCKPCASNCETCYGPGPNQCYSCIPGFGSFSGSYSYCSPCGVGCSSCWSATQCACGYGYNTIYSYVGTYTQTCIRDASITLPAGACGIANCAQCVSGVCTRCNATYGLTADLKPTCQPCNSNKSGCALCTKISKCDICNNSTHGPSNDGMCSPCTVKNCLSCSLAGAAKCDVCNDSFGLSVDAASCFECPAGCPSCSKSVNNNIVCPSCLPGYGQQQLSCDPYGACDYSCAKCPEKCNLCASYGAQTVPSCFACVIGYYQEYSYINNFASPSCKPCSDVNCDYCANVYVYAYGTSGGDSQACYGCKKGYYLDNVNTNPGAYAATTSIVIPSCKKCAANCDTCSGPGPQQCTTCINGFGMTTQSYGFCAPCNINQCASCCSSIGYNGSYCTACNPGFNQSYQYTATGHTSFCIRGNPQVALPTSNCLTANCSECANSPSVCTLCNVTFGLTADGKTCQPCKSGCAVCSKSLTQCQVCNSPTLGPNSDGTCSLCTASNCLSCGLSGPSTCDLCNETFGISSSKTCLRCPTGCQTCTFSASGNAFCSACAPGYGQVQKNCNSPTGCEYACVACSDSCRACSTYYSFGPNYQLLDNVTTCYSCLDNSYLDNTNASLPGVCKSCAPNCKTCGGARADQCYSCIDGFMPKDYTTWPYFCVSSQTSMTTSYASSITTGRPANTTSSPSIQPASSTSYNNTTSYSNTTTQRPGNMTTGVPQPSTTQNLLYTVTSALPTTPGGSSGSSRNIAFLVNNNNGDKGPFPVDKDIVWATVVYNEGSAYSATNGRFTAPIAGYYHFSVTILSVADATISVKIQCNGTPVAQAYTNVNKGYSSASTSTTLNLKKGDLVYVTLGQSAAIVNYGEQCVFNGFLIFTM